MAPPAQFQAEIEAASRGDLAARIALAAGGDAAPELLVALAVDGAEAVRRQVAQNLAAPPHADRLLAQDAAVPVRSRLARKLAAQAPGLAENLADRLARLSWEALLLLVQDPAPEVRHAVSDTLADLPNAPRDLVLALARDTVLLVCEPLVRLSSVLTEDDLLALARAPPGPASRLAVAGRLNLTGPVSRAVVESGEIPSIVALLGNPTAQIPDGAMDVLVALAGEEACLRAPFMTRRGQA